MQDTKKKPIPLPQGDQAFLDDFKRQWNDYHAQLHPLVDITPEGIDALFHEAEQRRHTQAVHRRRTAYSIAASVALLLGIGITLHWQLGADQSGTLVAENVMEPTIWDDGLMFSESRPIESRPVRAKARPRPATAVPATAPEAAPQDISAPLPSIVDFQDKPTPSVMCNHECNDHLLACDVYSCIDTLINSLT